jgi:serine protease AprX
MSLTRRNWFLHRVAPAGALFSAASGAAAGAAPALAAGGGHVDRRTKKAVTFDPKLRVHPRLQYGAQVEPDKKVRILVEKNSRAASSAAIAKAAGAASLGEFPLVKTLLLEVPQRAVLALGRNPDVRYISYDSDVKHHAINTTAIKTSYQATMNLFEAWNGALPATGKGVTVAVLDSGINDAHAAFGHGGLTSVRTNGDNDSSDDPNGHGTHVAGIIKGKDPLGRYIGVSPDAELISIKIGNRFGASKESNILEGLQWVFDNRAARNIKVVNLSVSAGTANSYVTSAICAAVEQLWINGVVVVVASGNRGATHTVDQTWYGPGNDPFCITVGALDDKETSAAADNAIAPFSSKGLTQDNFYKPEIVAPGRYIVAPLASRNCVLGKEKPAQRRENDTYIRLSGTSMAAPAVAGVAALLLERFPTLTPNQVKWLLIQTKKAYPGQPDTAGAVDPVGALQLAAAGSLGQANQGLTLSSAIDPVTGTVNMVANYWEANYWEANYWETSTWEAVHEPDDGVPEL